MGPIFLHAHNKTSQNFYVFRPFDDIMTTQYDHPRYVKHVLAHIYVVYTLFIPSFGCVLLGIHSLRGGLAEGNRILFVFWSGHCFGKDVPSCGSALAEGRGRNGPKDAW